jgi:hypothetical protein
MYSCFTSCCLERGPTYSLVQMFFLIVCLLWPSVLSCAPSSVGLYGSHVLPSGLTSSLGFSNNEIFSFDFSYSYPQPNLTTIRKTSRFSSDSSSFTVPVPFVRDITTTTVGTLLIFSGEEDGVISEVQADGTKFRVVANSKNNVSANEVYGGVYSPQRDVIFFLYDEGGLAGVERKTGKKGALSLLLLFFLSFLF